MMKMYSNEDTHCNNTRSKKKKTELLSRKSKQKEGEEKPSGMIRVRVEVKGGEEEN